MSPIPTKHILEQLRELFKSEYTPKHLSAYIIYSTDSHQSEYTSEPDQRRKFVSGFSGSAGTCVVTRNKALLWTDGRYFLQAEKQLDENWTLMKDGLPDTPSVEKWLSAELNDGDYVGTDPFFVSFDNWNKLSKTLKKSGIKLLGVEANFVDIVWEREGKPSFELCKPYIFDTKYAGCSWVEKVGAVREEMKKAGVDCLLLSALDDIAWLLNLRGADVHANPVFKAYIVITNDYLHFFIHESRITDEVSTYLEINSDVSRAVHVVLHEYDSLVQYFKDESKQYLRIWFDYFTPASIGLIVEKSKIYLGVNPVTLKKSEKNKVELDNIREACNKDAACLCEYFGYLEKNIDTLEIDEIAGENKLQSLRKSMENYIMDSFDTISSVGPNGSIIHYKSSPNTTLKITNEDVYLCDSGAQYLEGTTDITRTMHFGTPSAFEKETYTLVLKGHIAFACAVFPQGTVAKQLDSFARSHLWRAGLDYRHGTGHGIGMFLCCHEGPRSIRPVWPYDIPFTVGNLMSNEPGYYEDGKFGIRIENMIVVSEAKTEYNYKDIKFLGFETLSFIPMHQSLIEKSLLTNEEIDWINEYHKKCVTLVKPLCEKFGFTNGLEYLAKNTSPL